MKNNYAIVFNMPGKPDMVQYLTISPASEEEALIDAGYLAECFKLKVLGIEKASVTPLYVLDRDQI